MLWSEVEQIGDGLVTSVRNTNNSNNIYYLRLGRHPMAGVIFTLHYICTEYEG